MFKKTATTTALVGLVTLTLALTACSSGNSSAPRPSSTGVSNSSDFPAGSSNSVDVSLSKAGMPAGLTLSVARNDSFVPQGGSKFSEEGIIARYANDRTDGESVAVGDGVTFGNAQDFNDGVGGEPGSLDVSNICPTDSQSTVNGFELNTPSDVATSQEVVLAPGQAIFGCAVLDYRTIRKNLTVNLDPWDVQHEEHLAQVTVIAHVGDLFTKK